MAEPGLRDSEIEPLLTLGSGSPRRAQLLDRLGVTYVIETIAIDEAALVDDTDHDLTAQVARIARAKFAAFGPGDPPLLLTADTMVACRGVALGKPASNDAAAAALRSMSGQELTIASAVCFGVRGSDPELRIVSTTVELVELTPAMISDYIATGVGRDKAGGLALQSEAGAFIERVDGCWSNVVGLPLCRVRQLLAGRVSLAAGQGATTGACSAGLCGAVPASARW